MACLAIVAGLGVASRRLPPTAQLPTARSAIAAPTGSGQTAAQPQHGPRTVHFDLLAKLLADDRRSRDVAAWRQELAEHAERFRIVSQPHPLLGQTAPDFTLADHLDRPTRLTGLTARGPVFVVFYLGYSCNACIHHLVELSADVERFADLGSSIVAISADPAEQTRQRFEEYGPLPFPVLSDPAHAVAWQFEAMQAETAATADGAVGQPERPLHAALLIDRAGVVRWAYRGETPFRDTQAIFAELADLERCSPRPSPETIGP